MEDPPPTSGRSREHLDASGRRDVVFCHLCDNEWWRDEHGLICPRCHGEATEIVTPGNDPRSVNYSPDPPNPPEERNRPRDHDPWEDEDVPDPEEGDVEEYMHRSPSGRRTFYSSTFTTSGPGGTTRVNRQGPINPRDTTSVIRDFQTMIGTLMAPGLQQGQVGRSGPEMLFPRGEPEAPLRHGPFGAIPMGGEAPGHPPMIGHRFTVTATGRQPLDPNGQDLVADDLVTILGSLFGPGGPFEAPGERGAQPGGMPNAASGFLAGLLNPRNAIAGDAVYTQEALDRIVSALMEQHPQSNAPGPATPEAIANLPKKNLDEAMLGPELKAECSVCMDDVTVGVEVVVLPCNHWFHEACASAWLSEHNTCPICRTGIGGNADSSQPRNSSNRNPSPHSHFQAMQREWDRSSHSSRQPPPHNEVRINSIHGRSGFSMDPNSPNGRGDTSGSTSGSRRYQIIGDSDRYRNQNRTPSPPSIRGSYTSNFRRRDSEISERQRESRQNTSSSDRSQRSTDSGHGGSAGSSSGSGIGSWIRRFGRSEGGGGGSSHSRRERD